MADVKLFSQLTQVTDLDTIANNKIMALESDPKGSSGWKPTIDQLKSLYSRGGFDATVGLATTGSDYKLVQDAIDAGKTNILIIGDYTNSETVVTGANLITITIAKKWTMSEGYITIGAGGIDMEGHIEATYTLAANTPFLGAGKLRLNNFTLDMSNCTTSTSRFSDLTIGTQQIVTNGTLLFPNNDGAAFHSPGSNSLFDNLNLVGGGAASNGFVLGGDNCIIGNINVSGVWDPTRQFILNSGGSNGRFAVSNMLSSVSYELLILLTSNNAEFSNLKGNFTPSFLGASNCKFANCELYNLDYQSGTIDNNYFVNCVFNGTTAISIPNDYNQFVSCRFNAPFTLTVASNNNQLLLCRGVAGFTDNGTNNAIIEEVSNVVNASSTNRQAADAKAIYDAISASSDLTVQDLTSDLGAGGVTNFTITTSPAAPNKSLLFYNGQLQIYGINYTILGTTLTWIITPPSFALSSDDGINSFWIFYDVTIAPSYPPTAFKAQVSSDHIAVTGDGTAYIILLQSKLYDKQNNYNPATGQYTAAFDQIFNTGGSILLGGTINAAHEVSAAFIHRNSGGSILNTTTYYLAKPFPVLDGSGKAIICGSTDFELSTGDTVEMFVVGTGGAKTIDIVNTSTEFYGHVVAEL